MKIAKGYSLIIARTTAEFYAGKDLFREYAASLDFDLCFQGFDRELEEITLQYGEPEGALVLITSSNNYVGCAGIRKFEEGIAELKRMYIQPAHRKKGLGAVLLSTTCQLARDMHYERMRLDTLKTMKGAIRLYESFDFQPINSYRYNPMDDVLYFEKSLI